MAPSWAQDGPKMAPKSPQAGRRCLDEAYFSSTSTGIMHSSLRRQDGPKLAQHGPKMAPRWPQDGPKMAPKSPQVGRRCLDEGLFFVDLNEDYAFQP